MAENSLVTSSHGRSRADRSAGIERRKHKRFQVRDLAFAKLWSDHEKEYVRDMGQLVDISSAGLSLRYFEKAEKLGEHAEMGIFLSGHNFYIDKIPFKIVSDIEMTGTLSLKRQAVRRYGVQFDQLTSDQQSKLDHFLQSHTIGEA